MTPTCGRCNTRHFNFWSCERAEKDRKRGTGVPVQWAKREGWTEFGDRLYSVDRQGANTFMLRKQDGEEED